MTILELDNFKSGLSHCLQHFWLQLQVRKNITNLKSHEDTPSSRASFEKEKEQPWSKVPPHIRHIARIFRRGVTCMHKHARLGGSGGMLCQEIFLENRCSEIASEAILGQKQNHSSYMAHG